MKFSNTIDDLNKRSSIFSTQSFLSAFHLKDSQSISYAVVLIAVCLVSRFLTSIYYIEDIDSLRFAHSLVEYDLTKLQPHFPGYPVFCLLAKILYGISGSMAFSFSLIGAFSVIVLVYALLRILNWQLRSLEGTILAVLIAANPLIWIMSNRYMPDLMGVACLFLGTYYIISGYRSSNNHQLLIGAILAGFLAGIRLSYIPFIAPLLLIIFIQTKERISFLIAGLGGVVIWLLPLIYLTGWDAFLASAMRQTSGHFGDFGGSIVTEPDSWKRLIETTRTIWADGL